MAKIDYWKLTEKQKQLFRKKLIDNGISVLDIPVVPYETKDGCYPLSWAQKEILPYAQEDGAAYIMCNAIHIRRRMDPKLIQQAMQFMVEKHEVMRIAFVNKEGSFFQTVSEISDVKINIVDLQDYSEEERYSKAKQLLSEDGRIPFEVSDYPFYRVTLYKLGKEECILGISMHHFITDSLSLQMLTVDFLDMYLKLENGNQISMEVPSVRFTDYALWQNEWIRPDMLQNELKYWKQTLKDIKSSYSLPEDYKKTDADQLSGGFVVSCFDEALTERIRSFAAEKRISVFQLLLAVYMILISRYRSDPDVALSTPVSGRIRKEIQSIPGFFAHGMIIRSFVDENKSFSEVLKCLSLQVDQAFNNQYVPIDLICEEVDEKDAVNIGKIFDMFFTFHNYQEYDPIIPFEQVNFSNNTAKGDVSIELTERKNYIDVTVEYNLSLYRRETIELFVKNYISLLRNCLDSPLDLIKNIDVYNSEDALRFYEVANRTKRDYDYHNNVYDMIAEQACVTPDNVALYEDDKEITYKELLNSVDKECAFLKEKGIKKGSQIGVRLRPSKELIISLIAILKTGCTYVPLDYQLPQKRVGIISEKAGITAILSDDKNESDLKKNLFYYVGNDAGFWREEAYRIERESIDPEDNAYIMFTSGSTGTPKGVQISHSNMVNFLLSMKEELGFREKQSFLSLTTYSFDISVLEIFLPLICGGSVIVSSDNLNRDIAKLKQVISRYSPDFIQATPALWITLFKSGFECGRDTVALCGGEAMDRDLVEKLERMFDKSFNMYGPTETTVWSLMYKLDKNKHDSFIGWPIGNTTAYVLDKKHKQVAPGFIGELYIGGAGVSKGYYNDPEETQKRFIDNPFGEGKLFYTGDLAKCYDNGCYEYCGRNDQQVKVHGYRIETKEIELCLKKHSLIDNCAVVATNGDSDEKILAAYIQPVRNAVALPDIQELKDHIREELPAYMIPSVFVFLDALPLTYNLKVDRKSLMERKVTEIMDHTYVAPQNEIQELLTKIWSEELKKERLGIRDDFFSIGGHSLSMIRIKETLYRRFNISVPLSWFSKYPTVEKMSKAIAEQADKMFVKDKESNKPETAVVFDKDNLYEPFDLTPVQAAYWVARNSKGSLGGISTHIYRESVIKGLNVEMLEKAINIVIARHDMLRTVFLENGKQQIQKEVPYYHLKKHFCVENDQKSADELRKVRDEMCSQVFDPEKWPLFDVRISYMPDNLARIHMSFDCLIGDARSFQIILDELAVCYAGKEKTLRPINYSFRDYILTTANNTDIPEYQLAREYWTKKIPDMPDKPLLSLKCEPALIHKPSFARKNFCLGKEQYIKLKEVAERYHVTKTVVLLTAFSEILALYSRKSRFTLNLTLFDRETIHPDINSIVGDFTTGVLLDVDMSGNGSPLVYAERIRDTLITNLEHRRFSSVDVTREMLNSGYITESFPVVFTSLLDVYEETHSFENTLGVVDDKESVRYSISQTPQVWLDHQAMETDGQLFINWDYVVDLFDNDMIDNMFEDYTKLIIELLDHETWICTEPLAQDHSRYKYRIALEPALDFEESDDSDELMITRFIDNVKKNGAAVAVITDNMAITYDELDRMSDVLALSIIKKNTAECVGIIMEKGWEQIVAALAIQKAGKAYVPIDAALPEKRIQKIIDLCGLELCLATEEFTGKIQSEVIIVSDKLCGKELALDDRSSIERSLKRVNAEDKAYIIFTSGSTGEPKGVVISHKGAMNTINDINARWNVNKNDRILALSSMSFDLSVYDVFGLLSVGGAIVIPDKERVKDPYHWDELLEKYKITIWNSVPAFMSMYTEIESDKQKGIKNLRLILLSGDWIPVDLPERIWKSNNNAEIISLGGATEASIWSIYHPITEVRPGQASIPYGKSLSGQKMFVLNEKKMLCPVGVEGDIFIGGKGLADGYINDPVRTQERFIVHPLTGERLYDTGDVGRYTDDGTIIFLGRRDDQVKMNGHRIECGEIQAIIRRCPGVEDAVVMPSKKNRNSLTAFVKKKMINETYDIILDYAKRKEIKLEQRSIRKDIKSQEIVLNNPYQKSDYFRRKSYRQFIKDEIPLADFSAWLSSLSGYRNAEMLLPKYRYASAGALYPVQIYIYVKAGRIEDIKGGYYYYNPERNSLQLLSEECDNQEKYHVHQNKIIEGDSAFSVFLVADLESIRLLYGKENAYIYSLIEAGTITGLLEQEGLKNKIGLCQIGILDFDKIRNKLRLSSAHKYLHMFAGGMISEEMIAQNSEISLPEVQIEDNASAGNKDASVQDMDAEKLKDHLKEFLPDYMIPKTVVFVDEIVLTSNNKVDYKYLASLEERSEDQPANEVSTINTDALSAEEAAVLDVWKQVLNRNNIGLNDNFFDIGGTSLKIVQVNKLLNQRFGCELDIIVLFRNPTIKALASVIKKPVKENSAIGRAEKRAEKRLRMQRNRIN